MARGQAQAADQQRALQNQINQQLLGEREQGRSTLLPEYQRLLTGGGYSPAEQAAITGESMGALGSAFDALQQNAANRVARTHNAAGYGELEDELAREQGRQAAGLARQSQIDFANEAERRREAALRGMGSLYGVDTSLLGSALGVPTGLLQARAAGKSGFGFGLGPFGFNFSG
jgi:hypothetical protein